jgi:hypothetical protein
MPRFLSLSLALIVLASSASLARADEDDPEPPPRTMSLDQILKKYPQDKDAIEKLYQSVLRRKPTAEEAAKWAKLFEKMPARGDEVRQKVYREVEAMLRREKESRDRRQREEKR